MRRACTDAVLEGRATFREAFKAMFDSISAPFDECLALLCDWVELDPHFKDFYEWAKTHNVPVIVVSSGLLDIIRALLVHLIGPDAHDIQIVANDIQDRPGKHRNEPGGWEAKFHDSSDHGHDKSLAIRPYANLPGEIRPILIYAGDGVSDLSAARETDLLFAKAGYEGSPFNMRELLDPLQMAEEAFTPAATPQARAVPTKSFIELVPQLARLTAAVREWTMLAAGAEAEGR
ncbi:MAG: hypothetical protein M1826_003060 [Phylliscum demangeonii]|nr:MAG: hypothetical protein M1826_003060 [Phylliscum demangeonii]